MNGNEVVRRTTDGNFVEGSRHHSDEHIEQHDCGAPVVDAENDVAEALGKPAPVSFQLDRSRVL